MPASPAYVRSIAAPGRRDDVVARSAQRGGGELGAIVERGVGRGVRDVGDRVGVLAAHRDVAGEDERVVVGPVHGVDRVAEEAGHAVKALWHGVEVQTVGRLPFVHGHRRVALHAEVAERAVRLPLPALVHRAEDGVVGGVGVHARRPVRVVVRVALFARGGIEQRRARVVRRSGALRRARDHRRGRPDDAGGDGVSEAEPRGDPPDGEFERSSARSTLDGESERSSARSKLGDPPADLHGNAPPAIHWTIVHRSPAERKLGPRGMW